MPNGMAVTRMTPRNSKPANTWPNAGSGNEKPKFATDAVELLEAHAADSRGRTAVEPQAMQRADGDGDQAGRDALEVAHAAEPARQDDGEADHADDRRHEHLERRAASR